MGQLRLVSGPGTQRPTFDPTGGRHAALVALLVCFVLIEEAGKAPCFRLSNDQVSQMKSWIKHEC